MTRRVGKGQPDQAIHDIPLFAPSGSTGEFQVGSLHVQFDVAAMYRDLYATYSARFLAILAVLALSMSLTLWVLDRQVIRHLRRVSAFVEAVTPETLSHPLVVARPRGPDDHDELDQLIDGVERMRASLEQNIGTLQSSLLHQRVAEEEVRRLNASLELKVRERTRALADERERGNVVMALTRSGYFDTEAGSDQIFANRFARALLGLEGDAPVSAADILAWVRTHTPSIGEQLRAWAQLKPGSEGYADFELPFRRYDDGRVVWLQVRRVRGTGERGRHVYGAIRDITDDMAARRDLAEARDAAEQASRSKSEFLANMSHEIRTPLNGMLGMVQLLERTGLDERQRGYVGKLKYSADILLGVINDILDFSKIEAGQLAIERVPFSLREVVDNAVALIATRAEQKGLRVELDWEVGLPEGIVGDPLRVSQVLANLGSNAVKFTHSGEVRVRVAYADTARTTLHFEVEDTGIGMEESAAERLFAPFAQADGSISRRFGGTGLGLAICKRLVAGMGGHIGVSSRPGEGSRFWFTLPVEAALIVTPALPALALDASGGPAPLLGVRVLLADDNPINRDVAVELLNAAGAAVAVAEDGAQALARLAQMQAAGQPPDVVLMDIQMPVMDGFTATAQLRAQPASAQLPVIAMTAHGLSGDRERSLAAGMNDHVAKPVSSEALIATVLRWARPALAQIPPRPPAVLEPPAPTAAPAAAPALRDGPHIQPSDALPRLNHSAKTYLRLLALFPDQCAEVQAQWRAADEAVARAKLAHRIKGSAATLGMTGLRTLAARIESDLLAGAVLPEADLSALDEALTACRNEAEALLARCTPIPCAQTAQGQQAGADWRLLADAVRGHLRRFARPPAALLEELMRALHGAGKDARHFSERLAAFDMTGAAQALETLSEESSP